MTDHADIPPEGAVDSVAAASPADGWSGEIQLSRLAWYVRARRRAVSLAVVLVSVLTCVALGTIAGWRHLSPHIDHLDWVFLPVMVGAHLVAYGGYLITHHEVFNQRRSRRIGWRLSSRVAVIGFGGWLIGGGFTVDRHAHISAGFSDSDAGSAVIALSALELAVLTPAAWGCALAVQHARGLSSSVSWPWIVAVPAGFLLALVLIVVRYVRRNLQPPRHLARVRRLADGLEATLELVSDPRRGPAALAGIAVYWAADIFALYAALRFAHASVAFPRLVLAYATAYFLTRRTLPFAGAVIIEVLLAVSLVWVGMPLAVAVLAVLAYRLSDFLLTLSGALAVSTAMEGRLTFLPPGSAAERAADAQPVSR